MRWQFVGGMAKADPDGYTLLHMNYGNAVSAALFRKLPFDIKADFQPISAMGFFDVVMLAIKSKDIAVAFEIISPSLPLIRSGEIKALAVSSSHRFKGLADTPTLLESGVKGYEVTAWNGVAAPAKTPRTIIDRLNKEINAALAQRVREFAQRLKVAHPLLMLELMQRPAASSENLETWMEIYRHPEGISEALALAIHALAVEMGLPAKRASEVFVPLAF